MSHLKGNMFHVRVLIFVLAVQILPSAISTVAVKIDSKTTSSKNVSQSVTQTSSVSQATPIQKKKICDLCACNGTVVDCTGRKLSENMTSYQWPETKMTEVLLINASLSKITRFPSTQIYKLVIRDNTITNIESAAFRLILSLTELDLSNNNISDKILIPEVFMGNTSAEAYDPLNFLTNLNLSSNKLNHLNQDVFEHISSIRVLSLANNPVGPFSYETKVALNYLVHLEDLDLSNCNLTDIPHDLDKAMSTLTALDLSGNSFQDPPLIFESAKKLENLSMSSNPIYLLQKKNAFRTMLQLKQLHLDNMPNLIKVEAGALSNLPSLEKLSIQNCPKFFYISGDSLVNHNNPRAYLPPLKQLELSNNSLHLFPMELAPWDRMEELHLMNNQWTCDCENKDLIQKFLPEIGKKLLKDEINSLTCYSPPEFAGKKLINLTHVVLRCQNVYPLEEEVAHESAFLMGILIGLLIGIPLMLSIFVFWRKGYFVCGNKPASYSRAFYRRTANDEYN